MTTDVDPLFSFDVHVRRRILPALARVDGLEGALEEVLGCFDALAARDLAFDLRAGPPYASNLCADDCALELAYTFGGRDTCGVRYSYEPTAKKSFLKPRHALGRDRIKAALRLAGDRHGVAYDLESFSMLFARALPADVQLAVGADATACIAAIHHYRARPPRVKAYFSVDYIDTARALATTRDLVGALEDPARTEHLEAFLSCWPAGCGVRMVGFDFEPDAPVEVKVYRQGDGLSPERLTSLVELAGGGAEAQAGLAAFQDVFFDGDRDPACLNLVAFAPEARGGARLKLYLRPLERYGDDEALSRLERWYAYLGRAEELESVRAGLRAVAPLDVLAHTRGFFNYFSVDVGQGGIAKTSVYFAPLLPLAWLAREAPERLATL